jgi:enoyl-CoA hydratase/carnithine racemase
MQQDANDPQPLVVASRPDAGIVLLRLNRPAKLNALSKPVLKELADQLGAVEADPGTACVILTGAGRAFSAGADINDMLERGLASYADPERLALWGRVQTFPKPMIAAINGFAFGGGLELALLCDILIAAENARFATPEITIGSFPGDGGTQRLARLVGKSFAMQMILTGQPIGADLAERKGLVSEVVPEAQLLARSVEIGRQIAAHSVAVTPYAKAAVNAAFEMPLAAGLTHERQLATEAFTLEDRHEGLRAFAEKRPPKFSGK